MTYQCGRSWTLTHRFRLGSTTLPLPFWAPATRSPPSLFPKQVKLSLSSGLLGKLFRHCPSTCVIYLFFFPVGMKAPGAQAPGLSSSLLCHHCPPVAGADRAKVVHVLHIPTPGTCVAVHHLETVFFQWFLKLQSCSMEEMVTELTHVVSLTSSPGAQEPPRSSLDVWELALQTLPKAKVSGGDVLQPCPALLRMSWCLKAGPPPPAHCSCFHPTVRLHSLAWNCENLFGLRAPTGHWGKGARRTVSSHGDLNGQTECNLAS